MAGNRFAAVTAEVATGTSLKTIAQILAAANHGLLVGRVEVSFEGIAPTDAPILVEVLRQTTAGTMSSLTPTKIDADNNDTLQVTAQHTSTSEPTAGDVLFTRFVHPQGGYTWAFAGNDRIRVPGGGRLGVRVTAGVTVGCVVGIFGEE